MMALALLADLTGTLALLFFAIGALWTGILWFRNKELISQNQELRGENFEHEVEKIRNKYITNSLQSVVDESNRKWNERDDLKKE
jgi:hypothetical protein